MSGRASRRDWPRPEAEPDAPLDHALPVIDEADPRWQDHVRVKISEAFADPRPTIPADEAFRRIDERFADFRAKNGL